MGISERLRELDQRILRDRPSAARDAWGRRYGWTVPAVLGLLLVMFGVWALGSDRPAMAGAPLGVGLFAMMLGTYALTKRSR